MRMAVTYTVQSNLIVVNAERSFPASEKEGGGHAVGTWWKQKCSQDGHSLALYRLQGVYLRAGVHLQTATGIVSQAGALDAEKGCFTFTAERQRERWPYFALSAWTFQVSLRLRCILVCKGPKGGGGEQKIFIPFVFTRHLWRAAILDELSRAPCTEKAATFKLSRQHCWTARDEASSLQPQREGATGDTPISTTASLLALKQHTRCSSLTDFKLHTHLPLQRTITFIYIYYRHVTITIL